MAKARSAPGGPRPTRPPCSPPAAASGRGGPLGYFRGVWEELKKVVWPARQELARMTGIVIATVIIFAALVGGADYLLSLGVKQAITTQASSATPTAAPAATAPPTAVPTVAPTAGRQPCRRSRRGRMNIAVSNAAVSAKDARWYVVHAYSGHEEKVRANLLKRVESMDMHDQIFDVLVPTEEVMEIKDGQRRKVSKRIFPGYILVNMVMSDESWYVVRNTPGVTSFVGSGNKPVPLQEHEIRGIQKQVKAEAPTKVNVEYEVGENVRVIDGPFTDFHGKVTEINVEKGKLKVLVNMFGRETPVELDLLQVERLR